MEKNYSGLKVKVLILLCSIFFISLSNQLLGQVLFTPAELQKANTADTVSYMQDEEKKVIMYINLARMNGIKFYKSIIVPYVKRKHLMPDAENLISLKSDLQKVKNLQLIYPYKALCLSATFHAKDIGSKGVYGHDSTDGTLFQNRIQRFFPECVYAEETCAYGVSSAVDIVCGALVDFGVPSLGHRKSIIHLSLRIAGVSITTHKNYEYCCVIDYSSNKLPVE